MSHYDNYQSSGAYPPPPNQQVYPPPPPQSYPPPVQGYHDGPYVAPPPVSNYPMKNGVEHTKKSPSPESKKQRWCLCCLKCIQCCCECLANMPS